YSFTGSGSDGAEPVAGLIADASGNLFGTTEYGGSSRAGTVFELVKGTSGYTPSTLHSFTGGLAPNDGDAPLAGLIADASGDLFGTTKLGGSYGEGTFFELVKGPSGYTSSTLNAVSGSRAGLIADTSGDLFGTTMGPGNFQGASGWG